jgi:hypothetical protein
MILEGYGIEILVNNNSPLREYSEPYETSKEVVLYKEFTIILLFICKSRYYSSLNKL